jgi:hypothetical protein
MMSAFQREEFSRSATTLASETLARNGDLRSSLSPLFQQARHEHPDEEDRLLELWDRLTSHRVL